MCELMSHKKLEYYTLNNTLLMVVFFILSAYRINALKKMLEVGIHT